MNKTNEKIRKRNLEYKRKNKEKLYKKFREYYKSDEGKDYFRNYYLKNKERLSEKNKEYRNKNRNKINKQKTEYLKKLYSKDKNYNLICRMRRQFYNRFKKKHNVFREKETFGIEWNKVLESLSPIPKNIEDFHIDHIIPLRHFNFYHLDGSLNSIEIKKAWSPANLKIIDSKTNLEKGGRVDLVNHPLDYERCLQQNV